MKCCNSCKSGKKLVALRHKSRRQKQRFQKLRERLKSAYEINQRLTNIISLYQQQCAADTYPSEDSSPCSSPDFTRQQGAADAAAARDLLSLPSKEVHANANRSGAVNLPGHCEITQTAAGLSSDPSGSAYSTSIRDMPVI